jgi:gamma-glutamyltranspeptidase/glutathione hydrolase
MAVLFPAGFFVGCRLVRLVMHLSRVLIAEHAAVASEHPLASLAGFDALKRGGNAFDAAAATSFTLAVTMPQIGGLGGDFFGMLYEAKTGKVHCLNSSGWAPSGLTLELVGPPGKTRMPTRGALSCVVPGQVAGVWAMQRRFGRLPFGILLNAAKSYASEGFPASEGFCRSTAAAFGSLSAEAKAVFAPGGKPPVPGEWIRQENLGRAIEEIAEGGAEAFYHGWPSESIQKTLQALGVPTKESDFSDFEPEWVDPLILDYRGMRVFEVPPNSIGATSLLMLKLLARRRLAEFGPLSKERVALTMEAAEIAYRRKDEMLGDPRFGAIDIEKFMRPATAERGYTGLVQDGDTTAFSIADSEGNLFSGIQSLFNHHGSGVFVQRCGIMLNNRGSGFSLEGPNKLEPRKRPLHTLSSLILEHDETTRVAIGSSGGDYRPMQHTEFVTDMADYHLTLERTVEHPRFLWSEGRDLIIEAGYEEYASPRYNVRRLPMLETTNVCQAVESSARLRKAVCDVRGDGIPAGF